MMTKQYWEDLVEGQKLECKDTLFTKTEIMEFASKFDPLPFHIDEQAAEDSIFGGIIASSLHTLSACTRAIVDAQGDVAILSGLGLDEARMYKPVRPDDVLSIDAVWTGLRRSKSNPKRGFAGIKCKVSNQNGELVMEYGYRYMVECREDG